ncbi:hypothetical protein LTS18_005238, partial [Coniosporium uncinatum]
MPIVTRTPTASTTSQLFISPMDPAPALVEPVLPLAEGSPLEPPGDPELEDPDDPPLELDPLPDPEDPLEEDPEVPELPEEPAM